MAVLCLSNPRGNCGFPIKLPTRSGEGKGEEVPNEGCKKGTTKKTKTKQNKTKQSRLLAKKYSGFDYKTEDYEVELKTYNNKPRNNNVTTKQNIFYH